MPPLAILCILNWGQDTTVMAKGILVWYHTAGNFHSSKILHKCLRTLQNKFSWFLFSWDTSRSSQTPTKWLPRLFLNTCNSGISQVSHSRNRRRRRWRSKGPSCYNNDRVFLSCRGIGHHIYKDFPGLVHFSQFFFAVNLQKSQKKISIQQKFPTIWYFALAVKKCLSGDMRWDREKWKSGNHWELKAGLVVWAASVQTTERHVQPPNNHQPLQSTCTCTAQMLQLQHLSVTQYVPP